MVAHGWISDFLTFADEETHSTSVHVIKTSYDFSRNVKAIDKFIKAPSPDTLAFASNALEDISLAAENGIALGSAQVDDSGNVTDVVVENPPPDPNLTDPQIKAAIDATAAVVADALGSIDKPYAFTNVTAGVIGTFPLKMQRRDQYFTTMTRLVGNCEQAASLLGEMDPGTLRDSAEGKVISAKSAVFDELNDAFNNLITQRGDFQTQAATFQTQADGALAAANDPNGSAEYRRGAQQLYDASIILRDVLLANAELCLQLSRDVSQLTQRTNAIIIP